jgi:ParB/RepB/Spo0J family partition protein
MSTDSTLRIPFERLHDSPTQPRTVYNPTKMAELVASIKTLGVMQDIVVRPIINRPDIGEPGDHFEIVFGHRRRRAAELAGEADMPCRVRSMSDLEVAMAQLTENISREDMSFLDTADAFARLVRDHGLTVEQLMAQFGLSRSAVYNLLKLRSLTEASRLAVAEHNIGVEIATLIARVPAQFQPTAVRRVLHTPYGEDKPLLLSYREARKVLAGAYTVKLNQEDDGFSPYDQALTTCGACIGCGKYSDNDPALMGELGPGVCTDVPCHTAKVKAAHQRLVDEARQFGRVIEGARALELTGGMAHRVPVGYVWADTTTHREDKGKYWVIISYEQACQRLMDANIGAPSRTFIETNPDTLRAAYTTAEAAEINAALRELLGLPPAAAPVANTPSAAARAPEGGRGEDDEDHPDQDLEDDAQFSQPVARSPEAAAVTWQWPSILRAIMRKALVAERSTDDLRLVVATLADLGDELPEAVIDVMGWRETIDAACLSWGEDIDWLVEQLPAMSADQLGALAVLMALAHAPVISGMGSFDQRKIDLATRYGVDVLDPESMGKQQTDEAGPAGQAHGDELERDPNTADMFEVSR